MTSHAQFVRPPRLATWLVNLFVSGEEESMVGDLCEEFWQIASTAGAAPARRWYWRQSGKTIAHLFCTGFRAAWWRTVAAIVGGFFVGGFVNGLPDKALSAVTDRYILFWSSHFQAYMWVLKGMLIEHLILSILVGCIVASAAKGREMVATITLALVRCALIGAAVLWVATHLPLDVAWMLWSLADPFAIVVGGAIVRTRRSAGRTRPLPI
jgi:hypothetical protein